MILARIYYIYGKATQHRCWLVVKTFRDLQTGTLFFYTVFLYNSTKKCLLFSHNFPHSALFIISLTADWSWSRSFRTQSSRLDLETPIGRHVLGLFARDTPVVRLMDGFVMFPCRLVVHRKPFY